MRGSHLADEDGLAPRFATGLEAADGVGGESTCTDDWGGDGVVHLSRLSNDGQCYPQGQRNNDPAPSMLAPLALEVLANPEGAPMGELRGTLFYEGPSYGVELCLFLIKESLNSSNVILIIARGKKTISMETKSRL